MLCILPFLPLFQIVSVLGHFPLTSSHALCSQFLSPMSLSVSLFGKYTFSSLFTIIPPPPTPLSIVIRKLLPVLLSLNFSIPLANAYIPVPICSPSSFYTLVFCHISLRNTLWIILYIYLQLCHLHFSNICIALILSSFLFVSTLLHATEAGEGSVSLFLFFQTFLSFCSPFFFDSPPHSFISLISFWPFTFSDLTWHSIMLVWHLTMCQKKK